MDDESWMGALADDMGAMMQAEIKVFWDSVVHLEGVDVIAAIRTWPHNVVVHMMMMTTVNHVHGQEPQDRLKFMAAECMGEVKRRLELLSWDTAQ